MEDSEILEMFSELSKGKDYITEKALRKWDELEELIDSGLATKQTIDNYIKKINVKDGKVDLDGFRQFVELLDHVLVDESGNLTDDEGKAINPLAK